MILIYFIAFFGGLLSLLSPCSGAVLPVYFTIPLKEKKRIILGTLYYSLGIFTAALPLGLGITFLFNIFSNYGQLIYKIVGILFLIYAIYTLWISFRPKSETTQIGKLNRLFDYFLLGITSGFSLGTCTGPILGAILTASAVGFSYINTTIIISFYILGIVAPLFIISMGFSKLNILKRLFVVGRLFKIRISNKEYYIHSTNIILIVLYIFLFILFFFYSGIVDRMIPFHNHANSNWIYDIQDQIILRYFVN